MKKTLVWGAVLLPNLILSEYLCAQETIQVKESQVNRDNKKAIIAVEVVGSTGEGLRAGFFTGKDSLIEISGTTDRSATFADPASDFEDDEDLDFDFDLIDKKTLLLETKYKRFLGNSFYLDGGLGYEAWKVNYAPANESTLRGTASRLGATAHIGNQWQWSNFTMGCDWVGILVPLAASSDLEDNPAVIGAADRNRAAKNSIRGDLLTSDVHLLRFYLGASF